MSDLDDVRVKIDHIDTQLVTLLNQRACLGQDVAAIKGREGKPIYYPGRELAILKGITSINHGPLSDEAITAVFREIFSATRSVERGLMISCLGPEGTFSHLAAIRGFGSSAGYRLEKNFADVFSAVEKGVADYGLVPVENSLEGPIGATLDLLMASPLKIYGEVYLAINHNLVSKALDMSGVTKLYSHYMPLGQSRKWVTTHLPEVTVADAASSAEAVALAAKEPGAAAIGSREAAVAHGMNILAERIEDTSANQTRFFILSRDNAPKSGADKTSLALVVKDTPGALFKVLQPLSEREINLTKIESRPLRRGSWEYVFYIDCIGHVDEERVADALKELSALASELKVFGSYPNARG
jgi:chorismate mutase/prephenate dehydratase